MYKIFKYIIVFTICISFFAVPVFGADQNKDRKRDQDKVKDGSCLPLTDATSQKILAGRGNGSGNSGRTGDRDRLRDGSCLPLIDASSQMVLAGRGHGNGGGSSRGGGSNGGGTGTGSGSGDQDQDRDRLRDGSCIL